MSPFAVLLATSSWLAASAVGVDGADKYTAKYDNVDLQEILGNKRLFNSYAGCVMDEGPCTADGRELRVTIPDALTSGCSKCSEKQREGAKMVIKELKDKHAELWKRLKEKYDPEGLYEQKYQEELEKL